jgi:hypothetical protein
MSKYELAASIKVGLFASRDTLEEAFEYVEMMFNSMPDAAHQAAARTALHVMLNSVAKQIEALPNQLPPPPAEVRISVEDNPATGTEAATDINRILDNPVLVSVPRAELNRIIDQRISDWLDDRFDSMADEWFENNVDIDEKVQHYIDNDVDWTEIVRDELRQNITLSVTVD